MAKKNNRLLKGDQFFKDTILQQNVTRFGSIEAISCNQHLVYGYPKCNNYTYKITITIIVIVIFHDQ